MWSGTRSGYGKHGQGQDDGGVQPAGACGLGGEVSLTQPGVTPLLENPHLFRGEGLCFSSRWFRESAQVQSVSEHTQAPLQSRTRTRGTARAGGARASAAAPDP